MTQNNSAAPGGGFDQFELTDAIRDGIADAGFTEPRPIQVRAMPAALEGRDVDGLLVHLVDHPFIDKALVDHMIEQFYASQKLIVVPRCGDSRGHPVIFSKQLFPEFLAASVEQGAKPVVHAHQQDSLEIETDQAGVLIDIDTPEEYRKHVRNEEWPS